MQAVNPEKFQEAAATKKDLTVKEVRENLGHIVLTEREKALGLLKAYELATQRIHAEAKEKSRLSIQQEALRMWTYEEQRQYVLELGQTQARAHNFDFVVDEYNDHALHLLCLYFTEDPEFENYDFDGVPYSLKKGIWLQSPSRGTGKSFLLQLFRRNKRNSFHFQHVPELRSILLNKDIGMYEIEKRTKLVECPVQTFNFLQAEKGFMYDELFGEDKSNFMGNPFNISEYIIQRLYDQRKGADWFWKFHITSNYDGEAIEQKCGPTVRSRMAEMFNLIKLEGPDRRLIKK